MDVTTVAISLAAFTIVYAVLAAITAVIMARHVKAGLPASAQPRR
ncbi:hypothetical protein ABZ297_11905 [Nonomuraea sp. NPDC005983]